MSPSVTWGPTRWWEKAKEKKKKVYLFKSFWVLWSTFNDHHRVREPSPPPASEEGKWRGVKEGTHALDLQSGNCKSHCHKGAVHYDRVSENIHTNWDHCGSNCSSLVCCNINRLWADWVEYFVKWHTVTQDCCLLSDSRACASRQLHRNNKAFDFFKHSYWDTGWIILKRIEDHSIMRFFTACNEALLYFKDLIIWERVLLPATVHGYHDRRSGTF